MPKIRELPADERPREKLYRQGKTALSNTELLALLIGSGTKERGALALAQQLLASMEDGVASIGSATVEELTEVDGVGAAIAARILAAAELGARISATSVEKRVRLLCPEDVALIFQPKIAHEKQECFYTILLNVKGEKISDALISRGGVSEVDADPKDVFRPAVRRGAVGVILVHNHPSGDPKPSEADIRLTKRLSQAGKLLGVKVVDHVIIGKRGHSSLKSLKLM
jgi:DNA repair protein RadC